MNATAPIPNPSNIATSNSFVNYDKDYSQTLKDPVQESSDESSFNSTQSSKDSNEYVNPEELLGLRLDQVVESVKIIESNINFSPLPKQQDETVSPDKSSSPCQENIVPTGDNMCLVCEKWKIQKCTYNKNRPITCQSCHHFKKAHIYLNRHACPLFNNKPFICEYVDKCPTQWEYV